jgi:hypothetical protein
MLEESLPPDLRQIELKLGSLMQFQTPNALGDKLTRTVHGELRRERAASNWKFVVVLAGGAFLWLHLSFYAVEVTDFGYRGNRPVTTADLGVAKQHLDRPVKNDPLGIYWE